jgi:hypothetical protein
MASTFWDDALDAERPVTEQDVRGWIVGKGLLEEALNDYIRARNKIEPEFRCSLINKGYDDAKAEFGTHYVEITWTSYGRCGSTEDEHCSIPVEHLWADDWQTAIKADLERKAQEKLASEARAKAAKAAEAEKKRLDNEAHELALFKRLQEKFGGSHAPG